MSARHVSVQWNPRKIAYDAFVIAGVLLFTQVFQLVSRRAFDGGNALNSQILAMRAWGTCAFAMLTLILCIGPLARLDRRFLPILYNRRHLGVIFFFVALWHAKQVLDYYHAYGPISKLESLLTWDAAFTAASLPFQLFGAAALLILAVLAATSHDFWQKALGPRLWKGLHMGVYLAWLLVVLHVAFGALQLEHHPAWTGLVGGSVLLVSGLHVLAAQRSTAADRRPAPTVREGGSDWVDAGPARELEPGVAVSVSGPRGERIAVVLDDGGVSALHGVCAHQGGPLGEGRVLDGCLTCPWHGWQYRPRDGQSPPPYTEKIPTHRCRIDGRGHVMVELRAREAGAEIEPAPWPGEETTS